MIKNISFYLLAFQLYSFIVEPIVPISFYRRYYETELFIQKFSKMNLIYTTDVLDVSTEILFSLKHGHYYQMLHCIC